MSRVNRTIAKSSSPTRFSPISSMAVSANRRQASKEASKNKRKATRQPEDDHLRPWEKARDVLRKALWTKVYEEVESFVFAQTLPPLHPSVIEGFSALLPVKSSDLENRMTCVLDLDETLVHCGVDPSPDPDLTFNVQFNEQQYEVFCNKRPQLEQFIRFVAERFEVVVFTASQKCYAETVLDLIDPEHLIHHQLYRDSCVQVQGNYIKDLRVLGRDLSRTVIVDNCVAAFSYQLDNGIPVTSWIEDKSDTELKCLMDYLTYLSTMEDVRPTNRRSFNVRKLINSLEIR